MAITWSAIKRIVKHCTNNTCSHSSKLWSTRPNTCLPFTQCVCVYTYIMYTHSTGTFDPPPLFFFLFLFNVFVLVSFGFERGRREKTRKRNGLGRWLIRVSYVVYISATFAGEYTFFFSSSPFGTAVVTLVMYVCESFQWRWIFLSFLERMWFLLPVERSHVAVNASLGWCSPDHAFARSDH